MGDTGPGQLTRLGPRLVIPKRQTDPAMYGGERVCFKPARWRCAGSPPPIEGGPERSTG